MAEAHSRMHFSAVGQTAQVLAAGLLPLASSRILLTNKNNDTTVSVFLANHTGSSPYHSLVAQSSKVPCPRSRVPSLTQDPLSRVPTPWALRPEKTVDQHWECAQGNFCTVPSRRPPGFLLTVIIRTDPHHFREASRYLI